MVQNPFVDVATVAGWRDTEATLTVIDARAERMFLRGHIPGAVFLDARNLNSSADVARLLVTPDALGAILQDLGVSSGPVVVYGARGGSDGAHVWWTLDAMGVKDVWLLDGGIESWIAAGLPVSEDPQSLTPAISPLQMSPDSGAGIEIAEIRDRLGDDNLLMIDTRALEEFTGEDLLTDRGGHIPGAVLLPWDSLLTGDPQVLRPLEELQADLAGAMDVAEVATYCQSGVRAAHTYAVLKMLGHPRPRLYLGSWEEWGNDANVPIDQ
ncbi:MAG: sulfurtransferase [Alphaproteobacteria bacterium]|mgnify:FL=1|jgi:thiosulfate/3-mercaptopyruvate sulfurtransferase|nr:sulfurtransferase [Alphaproteobacteria bacterium]MBT4709976.1 sulfurtransferase [Alphaproteobacteria bacterium]MBT5859861.1 sulfurtransferase [Alphaproteobacteria bacterium]